MIRNPGGHCWRNPQRLVNAAKIIEREPACDSGPVVLEGLAEGVRQTCEPPKAHPRAQVAALDNRVVSCNALVDRLIGPSLALRCPMVE